jgi:hypothetical protein
MISPTPKLKIHGLVFSFLFIYQGFCVVAMYPGTVIGVEVAEMNIVQYPELRKIISW